MTPSVSGLRFLPAVLLITYLFFSQKIEESKFRILCAHGLWVLGALWSPESAFYVTFVWWPYYLFIRRDHGNSTSKGARFLINSGRLFLMGVALIISFNIIFRIIYHEGPTLYGFLAYAINPPGPMPINIRGGIWYFLFAMVIGVSALFCSWFRTGDTIAFRRGFLVQLLSYSVFSYFLGRSHDNNLLNIMPFVLLVLLNTISSEEGKFLPRASIVLTATFIGWVSLFGWNAWDANLKGGKLFQFDYKLLRDSASLSYPDTDFKVFNRFGKSSAFGLPQDAGRAITFLRMNYGEPVTVLDSSMLLEQSKVPEVWSAIHDPANFTSIPSSRRQEFLHRTAKSLKRSGWLIVDRNFHAEEWLADFDFAYERTSRIEFGTYYAIRYSPK